MKSRQTQSKRHLSVGQNLKGIFAENSGFRKPFNNPSCPKGNFNDDMQSFAQRTCEMNFVEHSCLQVTFNIIRSKRLESSQRCISENNLFNYVAMLSRKQACTIINNIHNT